MRIIQEIQGACDETSDARILARANLSSVEPVKISDFGASFDPYRHDYRAELSSRIFGHWALRVSAASTVKMSITGVVVIEH